jgi:transcriptional regulator of arginine metabolism
MNDRIERLKVIKEIISNHRIRNQEELLNFLKEKGVTVTQATLSRDLKSLRVGKVSDGNKGYFYSLPDQRSDREREEHFIEDIHRGTISLTSSGNLVVIHTMPGHANTVAFALDRLEIEEIAGTIAGDDTILLILAEGIAPSDLHKSMTSMVPNWEEYL